MLARLLRVSIVVELSALRYGDQLTFPFAFPPCLCTQTSRHLPSFTCHHLTLSPPFFCTVHLFFHTQIFPIFTRITILSPSLLQYPIRNLCIPSKLFHFRSPFNPAIEHVYLTLNNSTSLSYLKPSYPFLSIALHDISIQLYVTLINFSHTSFPFYVNLVHHSRFDQTVLRLFTRSRVIMHRP